MCKGGSTNGLNKHLKNIHDIVKDQPKSEAPKRKANDEPLNIPPLKKLSQPTIFKSIAEKESLPMILAKLVAVDGFTINAVTKSAFIRSSLQARGFTLPKNPSSVMNLVHTHSEELTQCAKSVNSLVLLKSYYKPLKPAKQQAKF